MIGNDIVDLQFAKQESNWRRPRFLQKLFTEEEQDFIHASANKEIAVWLLWTRKESVYKIVSRLEQRRFFAPKKIKHVNLTLLSIPCLPEMEKQQSQLSFGQYTFYTESLISNTHIHTIARLRGLELPISVHSFKMSKNDYKTQHQTTRKHLFSSYAEMTKHSKFRLSIQKDQWKTPHLYYKNEKQPVIISMSHHGLYGGYVLMLNNAC